LSRPPDDKLAGVESAILDKLQAPSVRRPIARPMRQIAGPVATDLLVADFAACELLVDSSPDKPEKGMRVYRGIGRDIPNLILELGRLREETFRTVGEGTGLERDIDQFDDDYDHFIAWDKAKREITGAYRIGRVDQILNERGPAGLYTQTFFQFGDLLDTDFREGTLEAGRSFVRVEFQRGLSLLFIWMALARFIMANPRYRNLMGPVSISNEFHENSKHLMVSYLMKNFPHAKSESVVSKNPPSFDSNLEPAELTSIVDAAINLSALQEFVRHAENNPRAQIPQLIKLYLELGVRFLAFNKDDEFNSIDGLIWLDITGIPHEVGARYFGEEGWSKYLAYHGKT